MKFAMYRLVAALCLGLGLCAAASSKAWAWNAASSWWKGNYTKARLVAATLPGVGVGAGEMLAAGLEIALDPGWKTYWRTPGGAVGVPPSFDFKGSLNLKSATVLFPSPKRFKDAGETSIGYLDDVVFPIRIVPADPSQPVTLKLTAFYGVCKDICVPADATLSLELVDKPGSGEDIAGLLGRFQALVPATADWPGVPVVESLTADLKASPPVLNIGARFAAGTAGADLFVEAADGSYIPVAVKTGEDAGGLVRYRVDLTDTGDAKALAGKMLILTLVSDAGNAEVRRTLP